LPNSNPNRRTALCADESAVDISEEIDQLSKKSQQLTKDIYSDLTPWQITKIARHPEPYTLDYVREIFTDFVELHGDRHFADDQSIVGGLALQRPRLHGAGPPEGPRHQGARRAQLRHDAPEGYRKALRLMKTAEKFKLPVFTFVDTPGAFPASTPRSAASPRPSAATSTRWRSSRCPSSPPSSAKGSGGALAIAVADQVLMLQYSSTR
jgi:acetyl-CoA carboxylase carboxyl transferase subunit alpha